MTDKEPLTAPVTALLAQMQSGDEADQQRLFNAVYVELSKAARHYLQAEGAGHTLQTNALVNEVYLRFAGDDVAVDDRHHFFALAARTMRRILVDHARSKSRHKRGGSASAVTFNEAAYVDPSANELVLDIHEALTRLAEKDARMAEIVELVYFGGLSHEATAETLGVSRSTVHNNLKFAQAWLRRAMGDD